MIFRNQVFFIKNDLKKVGEVYFGSANITYGVAKKDGRASQGMDAK